MVENFSQEFEDTMKDMYLIFKIDEQNYGIEIKYVIEIIGLMPITYVPNQEEYVKGIINLRGKIIPVIDARMRLLKPQKEYNERTCVIVTSINQFLVGIIVDHVSEVVVIEKEKISPLPQTYEKIEERFFKGVANLNDKLILLVDCETFVMPDRLTAF
ncbi:CheW protein [Caldicellulosiruptor owensensis OL]|uniref:CheW protein n=1 Tax=Caldicellulosiruptor owensensis (strain ATCC 700167 / DSM 13100 / OL) TaxID=632518 RepID=E4Q3A9_CALOW|nr:CheW protein [Caldicellulosiruptor owensensis OL]